MSFDAAFTDPPSNAVLGQETSAVLHELRWLPWLLKAPRPLVREDG
jgi:hypothetical protein